MKNKIFEKPTKETYILVGVKDGVDFRTKDFRENVNILSMSLYCKVIEIHDTTSMSFAEGSVKIKDRIITETHDNTPKAFISAVFDTVAMLDIIKYPGDKVYAQTTLLHLSRTDDYLIAYSDFGIEQHIVKLKDKSLEKSTIGVMNSAAKIRNESSAMKSFSNLVDDKMIEEDSEVKEQLICEDPLEPAEVSIDDEVIEGSLENKVKVAEKPSGNRRLMYKYVAEDPLGYKYEFYTMKQLTEISDLTFNEAKHLCSKGALKRKGWTCERSEIVSE